MGMQLEDVHTHQTTLYDSIGGDCWAFRPLFFKFNNKASSFLNLSKTTSREYAFVETDGNEAYDIPKESAESPYSFPLCYVS